MKRIILPLLFIWSTSIIISRRFKRGGSTQLQQMYSRPRPFLASDCLETGEKGEWLSAEYIASMLRVIEHIACGDSNNCDRPPER
ncbi:MAG: hypothetical protein R2744_08255 [Bacteroidales bacterium]